MIVRWVLGLIARGPTHDVGATYSPESVARGHEKILVGGQLSPGWRTPEILVHGQVISVVAI
jgi:hypothetical protein